MAYFEGSVQERLLSQDWAVADLVPHKRGFLHLQQNHPGHANPRIFLLLVSLFQNPKDLHLRK
jgi:hypothetical protein